MDDILLTEEQNLFIGNNDLKIGFSDDQNIYDILISEKGEYKRTPQIGVGANNLLNANIDIQAIKNNVRLNLEIDGFVVQDVEVTVDSDNYIINPICTR
jgi:hypothetical protein